MKIIMKKIFFYIFTAASLLTACDNNNLIVEPEEEKTAVSSNNTTSPSLVRKWYYNSDDDRYYYEFKSNGTVIYSYYQNIGPLNSALNSFVTKKGHWSYLNEEKTKFSIGWDDCIDCWYDIVSEDSEKMEIRKDGAGPAGWGLHSVTTLLKSAQKVVYNVNEDIKDLMGTWYYDETKDGKYLKFQPDGICYFYHYQYYGSSSIVSSLNGWVSTKGVWSYTPNTKSLSISMNGEVSYSYDIVSLTKNECRLKMSENDPGYTSIIYTAPAIELYK